MIKPCRYARECIICICIWLHVVKLTVANAGWQMIASCSNWVVTCSLTFIVIPTSFLNSNFLQHLVCLIFIEYSQLRILATYISYVATILTSMCMDYISHVWLDSIPHVGAYVSYYHPARKGVWPCKCGITHHSVSQCLNH